MKRFGPWLLPLALLLVVVAGLLLEEGAQRGEGRPLADDTRPAGAAALTRYLRARGHMVEVVDDGLPAGGATWVLAAPTARMISPEEVRQLKAFVEAGGTLVVLMPAPEAQLHLSEWLTASPGKDLPPVFHGSWMPSPDVTLELGTAVAGAPGELVLAPGPTVQMGAAEAIPVARREEAVGLWYWPRGEGAVWVASGAGLIENRRIALGDHLAFWEGLAAQGPMQLIETFHHAATPPEPSRAMRLTLLQLVLCLLFAGWVLGPRLGPPRSSPAVLHRSSLETVRAFGWLLRRSRVEPELLGAQLSQLRQLASERLGVDAGAPLLEVAQAVEARCGRSSQWALAILQQLQLASAAQRIRPSRYAELARLGAELEQTLLGAGPRSVMGGVGRGRAA